MSNVFTLEDLNRELTNKFQPFVFKPSETQEFHLAPLLRVDKKVRAEVQAKLESINEDTNDEDEVIAALEYVLSAVTLDRKGNALIKVLGHDLAKLFIILEQWQKVTQVGEASSSPS